jgi:hypothetical protein
VLKNIYLKIIHLEHYRNFRRNIIMIALTTVIQETPMQQANVGAAMSPVAPAVRKIVVPQTEYQQNLRQTFNVLPNRGRDLRISGLGQKAPVSPQDQATFDAKFKDVAAAAKKNLSPAGVPAVAPATASQEMSGTNHAVAAVKKGAAAVGDAATAAGHAVTSGAKRAVELAGEHPAVAAGIAGATAALGLRRLLKGKG